MPSSLLLATGLLGALGVAVFSSWPAIAQFGGGGTVEVDANIISSTRLETTVSTAPGTWLAVAGDSAGTRLQAEVTGPAAGPVTVTGAVTVSGTVALGSATVAALNGRFCVPGGQGKVGVGNAAGGVPPEPGDGGTGAFQGRTSISVVYSSGTGIISCMASAVDGGLPICTFPAIGAQTAGFIVDQGGGAEMEVSDAYVLRCIHCTATGIPAAAAAVVSYVEMDCNQ